MKTTTGSSREMTKTEIKAVVEDATKYHQPSTLGVQETHERVRAIIRSASAAVIDNTPQCLEQTVALTKLREAMFWANAAVACGQYDPTAE